METGRHFVSYIAVAAFILVCEYSDARPPTDSLYGDYLYSGAIYPVPKKIHSHDKSHRHPKSKNDTSTAAKEIKAQRNTLSMIDSMKGNTQHMMDSMKGNTPYTTDSMKGKFQPAMDSMKRNTQITMDAMKGNTQTTMDSMKGNTQTTMDSMKGNTQPMMDSMKGNTPSATDSIKGNTQVTMDAMKGNTQPAMDSMKGNAYSTMDSMSDNAYSTSYSLYGDHVYSGAIYPISGAIPKKLPRKNKIDKMSIDSSQIDSKHKFDGKDSLQPSLCDDTYNDRYGVGKHFVRGARDVAFALVSGVEGLVDDLLTDIPLVPNVTSGVGGGLKAILCAIENGFSDIAGDLDSGLDIAKNGLVDFFKLKGPHPVLDIPVGIAGIAGETVKGAGQLVGDAVGGVRNALGEVLGAL